MAGKYNVAVGNAFEALATLPDDVEDSWSAISNTILQSARDTLPAVTITKRRWLTHETLSILEKKRDARIYR